MADGNERIHIDGATLADDTANARLWETPDFQTIGASEAETGILVGPEILILLS